MRGDRKTDIPCLLVYNNVWFNNYNHTMVMMYVHHTSIGCQKGSSNNWSDGVISSRNGSFANRNWNFCMNKTIESDWPWYFEILRYHIFRQNVTKPYIGKTKHKYRYWYAHMENMIGSEIATHLLPGAGIFTHIYPINDPVWSVNIPAPWSIWDMWVSSKL